MAKDNVETEVKLYVRDLDGVAKRIEAAGGTLKAERVLERNNRYDDTAGSFNAAGTVLRLRMDTRARLTYKDGERMQGQYGSSRTEIEVTVSDFDEMELILGKLGFHTILSYEKYRTTYELFDAEVTLDEMPYGHFVEIEGEQEAIKRCIEALDLQSAKRMPASYVVLFRYVKQHLGLDFQDLTFANFKGIDVPESAFEEA